MDSYQGSWFDSEDDPSESALVQVLYISIYIYVIQIHIYSFFLNMILIMFYNFDEILTHEFVIDIINICSVLVSGIVPNF